jgi:hypothetical protein
MFVFVQNLPAGLESSSVLQDAVFPAASNVIQRMIVGTVLMKETSVQKRLVLISRYGIQFSVYL